MRKHVGWLLCSTATWDPSPSNISGSLSLLSNCVLRVFAFSVLKVGNRVVPWRGRYNSSTGRVCLINACLSSLPMFLMGFYRLLEGTHAGFDKHRSGFYWNTADNKKKYRMVKWKVMC